MAEPTTQDRTAQGDPGAGGADLETVARVTRRVRDNIERVIEGKPDVVTAAVMVLLAEGHLLIEDVPGVGKTMLAKALAAVHRLLGAPHPVHARPAALGRHRVCRSSTSSAATSSSSRARSSRRS